MRVTPDTREDAVGTRLPQERVTRLGQAPLRASGKYVLYWMTASRRAHSSFALDRAVEVALELRVPLLVFEVLGADHRWASARFHRFVIDGMDDNRRHFAAAGVRYYPYVEPHRGAARGLLASLAKRACWVVTDEFPCFVTRRLPERAAAKLDVGLEMVDGCGLLPLRRGERVFPTAHAFRRHLQRELPRALDSMPDPTPLDRLEGAARAAVPQEVTKRWPAVSEALLEGHGALDGLPIDHGVAPVADVAGGSDAATTRLHRFLHAGLRAYGTSRNHPDDDGSSGLSPYLHFGHLGSHQVLQALAELREWTPEDVAPKATGSRAGWWNLPEADEAWLDQIVTWREVGLNMCFHRDDYDALSSLPTWAATTIAEHADDERPVLYGLQTLTDAQTLDPIWNAAQRQLVRTGRMHNYLRMLWGKKIYQWSANAQDALEAMIELNNRYAYDGRDPNSYSGIFWVLGRYDRAWGPERPIFGKLRYMTSDSTRRKLRLRSYLETYAS